MEHQPPAASVPDLPFVNQRDPAQRLGPDGAPAISRSQLWQWRVNGVALDNGRPMSAELYAAIRDEEISRLRSVVPSHRWTDAAGLLDDLVLADHFTEFLTLGAYPLLG